MSLKPTYDKKTQMAEQVHRLISGGNPKKDSPYHIREIELHIENALNNRIRIDMFEMMNSGDRAINGQYLVTFSDVQVSKDNSRGVSFINLPAKYISLPNNKGLWSIRPMGNERGSFIPVRAGSENFTDVRDAPHLQGRIGYKPEGNRAVFTQDLTNLSIEKVLVQLVVAADSNRLEVNVPANIEQDVIEYVYKLMLQKLPEDKVNDNNEQV